MIDPTDSGGKIAELGPVSRARGLFLSTRVKPLLFAVLAVALALRVCAVLWLPDQHLPDANTYRVIASHIRQTHSFDNQYYMPLYPLVIALIGDGRPQQLFDIVLSTITVWLIYDLTLTMFRDQRAALVAAALAAIYPYFIFYSVVGLTETLFTTLIVAAFASWYRGRFVLASVSTILSILTRPIMDVLPWFMIFYFALVIHRLPIRSAFWQVGAYALMYVLFLAPWWVYNYETYGSFVRLNLGFGHALYWGNNPQNQTGGVSDVQVDSSAFDKIADPVARDRAYRDAAIRNIEADPMHFLKLAGLKFLRYWRLYPFAEPYQNFTYVIASVLSFTPILALAIAFVLSSGRDTLVQVLPLLMFAGYLTVTHMIIVGSVRYRLPIEPFLIVLAAPMIMKIYDWLRRPDGHWQPWKA